MPFYELKQLIRDALACSFDATNKPRVIRLTGVPTIFYCSFRLT